MGAQASVQNETLSSGLVVGNYTSALGHTVMRMQFGTVSIERTIFYEEAAFLDMFKSEDLWTESNTYYTIDLSGVHKLEEAVTRLARATRRAGGQTSITNFYSFTNSTRSPISASESIIAQLGLIVSAYYHTPYPQPTICITGKSRLVVHGTGEKISAHQVRIGMRLQTTDGGTTVRSISENKVHEIYSFGGGLLGLTGNHAMYHKVGGWRLARDMVGGLRESVPGGVSVFGFRTDAPCADKLLTESGHLVESWDGKPASAVRTNSILDGIRRGCTEERLVTQ